MNPPISMQTLSEMSNEGFLDYLEQNPTKEGYEDMKAIRYGAIRLFRLQGFIVVRDLITKKRLLEVEKTEV